MKNSPFTQRIWSLLLCAALIFSYPHTVLADNGQRNADTPAILGVSLGLSGECGTVERLVELLEDSGTAHITLTDNIVFTELAQIGALSLDPVTIDMGDFGITVEKNAIIYIYREVYFQGNGVVTPLLTLASGSMMQLTSGSKLEATQDNAVAVCSYGGSLTGAFSIIADGQNATAFEGYSSSSISLLNSLYARGNGGVAARVAAGTAKLGSCNIFAADTALVATGDVVMTNTQIHSDNIALSASGSVEAKFSDIVGAVAIGGSLDAVLCDIEGSISSGGKITLDTCYAAPEPDNATIITRRTQWFTDFAGWYPVETFGFCIAPGEVPSLPDHLKVGIWEVEKEKTFTYLEVDVVHWRAVEGDTAGDVIGWVEAELDIPRLLYGSETKRTVRCPIRLYDPQQPYLISTNTREAFRKISITAAQMFEDADELILQVSVDDGETWTAYSSLEPDANTYYRYKAGLFTYLKPEENTAHLFHIEVVGGDVSGSSNIIRAWYSESGDRDPFTGDREGDGRDDGGEPGGTEPPGPGDGDGGGGTDETGNPPPSPPPPPPTDGGDGNDNNNDNAPDGGNGKEPPGYDRGGEGSTGDGDDGKPTGGGGNSNGGPSPRSSGGGTGSGRQDSAAAAGNPSAAGQVPIPAETPSNPAQPSESAQPVISPLSAAISSAYPEGASAYTATELAALALANPERIAFLEGRLRAVLPTPDLLEAAGGGSFAILLEESGVHGFHIRLYTEGGELADLGGAVFQVSLPLPDGCENPLCTAEDGDEIPIRAESGRLVCDLTRTGRYEVAFEPASAIMAMGNNPGPESGSPPPAGEDAPSGRQAAGRIVLACVAVCAAGFVFLRRRARHG